VKTEIEQLMDEDQIDLLWITGSAINNPAMVYVTGGGFLTRADYFQKRGEKPVLFHASMERDEAAKTGLPTKCYDQIAMAEYLKQCDGDQIQAQILLYEKILKELNFQSGRIALYGTMDVGTGLVVFSGIKQKFPEIEFVGYKLDGVLLRARATKDFEEVDRVRNMGKATIYVAEMLIDYLTHCPVRGGVLFDDMDRPLTVSVVKNKIDLWLSEKGAENPEGTIFSLGRDAAVPHSAGNPSDVVREGVPIVFDIFPREKGGGYFHDFTRTWCLGYAPDEVLRLYEDVLEVYRKVISQIQANQPFYTYHKMTCELFEMKGHPTVMMEAGTQAGYVHGLGHGVGLEVHELPYFNAVRGEKNHLKPGSVFTIEPGLYYPEMNMGVRLENTFWMRPGGELENLADFPLELVLPMSSS